MKLRTILETIFSIKSPPKKEKSVKREEPVVFPATEELLKTGIAQIIFDCCKEDCYKDTPRGIQIERAENPSMVGKKIDDFDYDVEIRNNDERYQLCIRMKEKGSAAKGYPYWILLDDFNRRFGTVVNQLGWSHSHYKFLSAKQVEFLERKFIKSENPKIKDYEIISKADSIIYPSNLPVIPQDIFADALKDPYEPVVSISRKDPYGPVISFSHHEDMSTQSRGGPGGAQPIRVHIRWMIRRDMPEVLRIEQASHDYPWCEEDFLRCLRQRNCIGMVAEQGDKIVGFMLYELHKTKLHILNFAVHAEFRRLGIGVQMAEKLVSKLSSHRRTRIVIAVRETNLDAQLFFRAAGFRATSVSREFYPDSGEDAYITEFRLPKLGEDSKTGAPATIKINRLAS